MTASTGSGKLHARHYVVYAAVCLLLGSNWPGVRVVVQSVPPLRSSAISYAIAAVLTAILAAFFRSPLPKLRDWRALLLLAFTIMAIPTAAVAWGEQYVTASLTSVLWAAFPVLVAVFMRLGGDKRVPLRAFAGLVIAAAGVTVLFWDGIPPTTMGRLGALVILGAVIECAAAVLYAARCPKSLTAGAGLACQFVLAAIMTGAATAALEHGKPAHWTPPVIVLQVALGIFCTALVLGLYYWLLRHIAPFQVGTIDLIVPIIAFTEGAVVLHEHVTRVMILAATVVLFATAFVLRIQHRRKTVSAPATSL